MALLASGNEEQARTVLREARRARRALTVSLQEKMMAFLRDSTRLFEALD